MFEDLKIITYPDPRLRKMSKPVKEFSTELAELARKMLELMRAAQGVGLAAPQVGKNIRLFVMNPTGEAGDDRIIVNPILTDADGQESAEEGCLSIPDIKAEILRGKTMKLTAQDANGKPVELVETGYIARIWQHETDHLNGILLMDRMGTLAKLSHRKKLREMEDKYADAHPQLAHSKTAAAKPARKKRK
jgi:peptide deformylase